MLSRNCRWCQQAALAGGFGFAALLALLMIQQGGLASLFGLVLLALVVRVLRGLFFPPKDKP